MRIRFRWILLLILGPALVAMASVPPNLDDALGAQRDLAARNPSDARVLNDLGNLLVLTGRLAEAEEIYIQAVALAPDNQAIRYNLALALQQEGRRKQAIKEYKTILDLNPNHAWSHYQLGTLYESMGRRERAVRSYARALELDADLLSPKVNPHIIENRLVTPSLILARWGDSSTAMAPRLYQQPARITDLLVPPLPEPEESDLPAEAESEEPEPEEDENVEAEAREVGPDDLTPTRRTRPAKPAATDPAPRTGIETTTAEEEDEEDESSAEEEDEDDRETSDDIAVEGGATEREGAPSGGGSGQVLTADDLVPSYVGQLQPRGQAPRGTPSGATGTRTRPVTPPVPPGTVSGGRSPIPSPTGNDPGTGTASTGRLELQLLPDRVDRLARLASGDPSEG